MRVILFRGKRTDGHGWIFGSLWDDCGVIRILSPGNVVGYTVIPETVGQYTGLMDKKGKRIFEGDFVKLDEDVKKIFGVNDGVVMYLGGCYLISGNSGQIRASLHTLTDINWVLRGEVIGNIYDNPELAGGAA